MTMEMQAKKMKKMPNELSELEGMVTYEEDNGKGDIDRGIETTKQIPLLSNNGPCMMISFG